MMHPTVSVVMPVYNAERYVAQAVESILGQKFGDFEFLIFVDGSTDESLSIVRSYSEQDSRARIFPMIHRGHVPLLNEAIVLAKGEFIARMDADDISMPDRFTRQVEYLRQQPDCVVVGSEVLMIDPDGEPIGRVKHVSHHEGIEADLLNGRGNVISHPACMMRRSALLAIGGYRDKYESLEDFDLWFRLAECGRLANLPVVLLHYRQHHASVNATQSDRQKALVDQIVGEARMRRGLEPLAHSVWQDFNVPDSRIDRHLKWAAFAAGSGFRTTGVRHALIALLAGPTKFRAWAILCRCLIPNIFKPLLRKSGIQELWNRWVIQ